MKTERIILGIDPGTTIMGYGLIKEFNGQIQLLAMGILELRKYKNHYTKLKKIFDRTLQLIDEYHPAEFAIESQFFGKNVQSMLKLGRGQGVAIAAALYRSLPIFEYSPRKIKMAITGRGAASKEQVAMFLKGMLNLKTIPDNFDSTDGVAVAICHSYQKTSTNDDVENTSTSWKDFISKNPNRIKGA